MSTGSISLDILLNKILTDAISGGNESIRAIQKRYPSLSEKEAHEILAMVSATAQSNDDSAELVVTAPPSFALKTKPTKVTVREMLMGARKSILITGYSLSDYFAELVDCVIQKSQEGVLSIVPILQMMPNLIHQKILQTIRKNFMRLSQTRQMKPAHKRFRSQRSAFQ